MTWQNPSIPQQQRGGGQAGDGLSSIPKHDVHFAGCSGGTQLCDSSQLSRSHTTAPLPVFPALLQSMQGFVQHLAVLLCWHSRGQPGTWLAATPGNYS